MSEPITDADLDAIDTRAAEVFTGPRMAADREELLRAFGENVPRLTQEIRRLREENENMRGVCREGWTKAGEWHSEIIILRAQLAAIRKAAESVIEEARLYDGWDALKKDDIFKALRALADTINEGVKT